MTIAKTNTQYVAEWTSHVNQLTSVALDTSQLNFREAQELLDSIKAKADRLIHLGMDGCNFRSLQATGMDKKQAS